MKKTFAIACITLVLSVACLAAPALAQTSRLYFAGYMGLNMVSEQEFGESTTTFSGDIESKNAISFAGALGLRFDNHWRLEGEISHSKADLNRADISTIGAGPSRDIGGSLSTTLYMANLYYDFDFEWQNLYPFLMAGVGMAWHNMDINNAGALPDATDTTATFAWTLGSGLKYRVSPNMALTTGYRYIGTPDLEVDTYDLDYSSHEVRFGLEYDIPVTMFK